MKEKLTLLKCVDVYGEDFWVPVKNIMRVKVSDFNPARFCIWFLDDEGMFDTATCDGKAANKIMEFIE